ncbi:glycosyltransferase family 2 protein [candidate division TA06 bacterium]|nr:glycosyltransferase family 2 protein [candidate division TA06 bacterium]
MTAPARPFISIIVPTYNEAGYIGRVLDDIAGQDYDPSRYEVLIADGRSSDRTREIVGEYAATRPGIKIIDNPGRFVPFGLNLAIKQSVGEIIVRMDAHSRYPQNYLSLLIEWGDRLGADNVGGVWITLPSNDSAKSRAIALALTHPLGVGNALYRLGSGKVKEVDTVPYGCYPKRVFEKIGLFDEQLLRNQDDEFNARLKRSGGKIFIIPDIKIKYFARENFSKLGKMYYQYGYFKPLVNKKIKIPANARQLAPAALILMPVVLSVLAWWNTGFGWVAFGLLSIYLLAVTGVSLSLSSGKVPGLFTGLMGSFFTIHFSYGWGYLRGIWDFIFFNKLPRSLTANR